MKQHDDVKATDGFKLEHVPYPDPQPLGDDEQAPKKAGKAQRTELTIHILPDDHPNAPDHLQTHSAEGRRPVGFEDRPFHQGDYLMWVDADKDRVVALVAAPDDRHLTAAELRSSLTRAFDALLAEVIKGD